MLVNGCSIRRRFCFSDHPFRRTFVVTFLIRLPDTLGIFSDILRVGNAKSIRKISFSNEINSFSVMTKSRHVVERSIFALELPEFSSNTNRTSRLKTISLSMDPRRLAI